MRKISIKTLVVLSLLTAMEIVLSRFLSVNTPTLKIGFGFVPIVVCAVLYGWAAAGATAALADFLGAVVFPIGPYFPGFTLTAALTGVVLGIFMHTKSPRFWRNMLPAAAINCFALSFGLNSVWLHMLYKTDYIALFTARSVQAALLFAAYLLILPIIKLITDKILHSENPTAYDAPVEIDSLQK